MAGEIAATGQTIGFRVVVIDYDDPVSQNFLMLLLHRCHYHVTTVSIALAMKLVMENEGKFDVLIADVDTWDLNGFQLIERLGKVLPIIVLSTNADQDQIKEALAKGACHCFVKPLQFEDLKNISKYIIEWGKKSCDNNVAQNNLFMRSEKNNHARPASMGQNNNGRSDRKRENQQSEREVRGNGQEEPNPNANRGQKEPIANPVPKKKPRLVWDERLKKNFEKAYYELGHENAVPKKILQLMDEPRLSRENVASHLQKFKQSLKKEEDRQLQQTAMSGNGMTIMPLEANVLTKRAGGISNGQFIRPNHSFMPMTVWPPLMQHGMFGIRGCVPNMNMFNGNTPNNVGHHQFGYPQNYPRNFGDELLNNSNSHPLNMVPPARLSPSMNEAQRPISNGACMRQLNNEFGNRVELSRLCSFFTNSNSEQQMRDPVQQQQHSQEDLIRIEAENSMVKSFEQMQDQVLPQEDLFMLCPKFMWSDPPPPLYTPSTPSPPPGSELILRPTGLQHESIPNDAIRINEAPFSTPNNLGNSNDGLIHNTLGLEQVHMNNLDGCNGFPARLGVENGFADGTLDGMGQNNGPWHP